ncbi:hypothetical protein J1N35_022313 [Gossypium stocksii]|uniref:Uncharacterized protein n=1 Tax=Gossypium stocksii TaxID=47602 RepID=A0A9D4A2N0_9ROSI|nr:hypothetical protein J1N35_022313 [Gossypium stocksii]
MKQCYYIGEEKNGSNGNCYSIPSKQKNRMGTEEDWKRNPIMQVARDMRKTDGVNDEISISQKILSIMKEKENESQSGMIKIQIEELKKGIFTELVAASKLNHHRNSWRCIDRKVEFDANMSEMNLGKHKFNNEMLVNGDSYPTNDNMNKRAKVNNGRVEGHANLVEVRVNLQDSLDLNQDISVATSSQVDQRQ